MLAPALDRLTALPGVTAAVEAARTACTELRWHPALRGRTAEVVAESNVRAAHASAALAGARFPLGLVRDVARGAAAFPDDAAGRTAMGGLRAVSLVQRLGPSWQTSPAQALARLHLAAAAGLLPDDSLGRPRLTGEEAGDGADLIAPGGEVVPAAQGAELAARLAGLSQLLAAPAANAALVVAALAHAEVATARPFVTANGVVARALCRAIVTGRGLDPAGVAGWEVALVAAGPAYPLALARYASGTADGMAHWLLTFATAIVGGAAEGAAVCDAVMAGRIPG